MMQGSRMRGLLILDGARSGEENMQIDAEMLRRAVAGEATVRTYQWSEPTVSLGYFQSLDDMIIPEALTELSRVQRLSGGGAILHHHELTYSFAIPKSHRRAQQPLSLYEIAHAVIIEALEQLGVKSTMREDAAFEDQSFLCFRRGDARDIVIGTHKIVGSAQRRRQGAILQHGSILLVQSAHVPEFPGIHELTGIEIHPRELAREILPKLGELLELDIQSPVGDSFRW